MKIGILALQGAFLEHKKCLEKLGCQVSEIRLPEQLNEIQGLIIPGGESTTIGKLMNDFALYEPIIKRVEEGMPIFGTCAGMILLAKDIYSSDQPRLGVMDVCVKRNAFGRQVDSFQTMIDIPVLGNSYPAVFIRAPYFWEIQPNVSILAEHENKIIMARQGNILACAFHPELTEDLRVHEYFVNMIRELE